MDRMGTREKINKLLKEYHDDGFLVEMNEGECKRKSKNTWYPPLFTVENPNKPGKIRLVWDAAALSHGV